MRQTSLIYVFNPQGQVLLCAKKKSNSGFEISLGKRNGAGGKKEEHETIVQSAVRELREETGISLHEEDLTHRGFNRFFYQNKPEWDQECHVFTIRNYEGEVEEKEELLPKRFNLDKIPYEKMRVNDTIRLPGLLEGDYAEYEFYFTEDGSKILCYEKLN